MAPPGQRIPGMWYPAVDDVMYGPRKRKPTQQETDRREQEEHQKSLKKAAKQQRTDANESKKKATEAKAAGKIAATAARPTRKATADATTAREESAAAGTSTKRAAAAAAAATTKKSKNANVTETCHHSQQVTAIVQVQVRLNTDRCQLRQSTHITLGLTLILTHSTLDLTLILRLLYVREVCCLRIAKLISLSLSRHLKMRLLLIRFLHSLAQHCTLMRCHSRIECSSLLMIVE